MKLGISGMVPGDPAAITADVLRSVRKMGFSGAAVSFRTGLDSLTPDVCHRLRSLFAEAGLEMVELGMYGSNLIHPDPGVRAENVGSLQKALLVAAELGKPAVITGSGSLNPRGQWFPHPENHGSAAYERMVASLKEAVKVAEDSGVMLALECHTFTALRSPEVARQTVDDVGSASLKVHLDPVNWITWDTIYRTGEAISHMFEVLEPRYLLGAHAKGVAIEDRLVIHMNETPSGAEGDVLDCVTFLRHVAKLPADTYLVIEHTPLDLIPRARDYVLAKAKEAGVSFSQ